MNLIIMDSNILFEETEEYNPYSLIKMYRKSKHFKKASETISTVSCTIEFDKHTNATPYSKCKDIYEGSVSCRNLIKRAKDLPDRLNHLKQITDNKIKFMRLEKEIKELSACTFKPKINTNNTKTVNFSKKQEDYTKAHNSNIVKLKFQYPPAASSCSTTPLLLNSKQTPEKITVYERLYNESRVFPKKLKYIKHH